MLIIFSSGSHYPMSVFTTDYRHTSSALLFSFTTPHVNSHWLTASLGNACYKMMPQWLKSGCLFPYVWCVAKLLIDWTRSPVIFPFECGFGAGASSFHPTRWNPSHSSVFLLTSKAPLRTPLQILTHRLFLWLSVYVCIDASLHSLSLSVCLCLSLF